MVSHEQRQTNSKFSQGVSVRGVCPLVETERCIRGIIFCEFIPITACHWLIKRKYRGVISLYEEHHSNKRLSTVC